MFSNAFGSADALLVVAKSDRKRLPHRTEEWQQGNSRNLAISELEVDNALANGDDHGLCSIGHT